MVSILALLIDFAHEQSSELAGLTFSTKPNNYMCVHNYILERTLHMLTVTQYFSANTLSSINSNNFCTLHPISQKFCSQVGPCMPLYMLKFQTDRLAHDQATADRVRSTQNRRSPNGAE